MLQRICDNMADRTYVYIDGESHFIRSQEAWRAIHGQDAQLERLRYIDPPDDALVLVEPRASVFWTRRFSPGADRSVYFSAITCDPTTMHELNRRLRDFDLDSEVVKERKDLRNGRANELSCRGYIEKPKGVDIALAVKMLHDAYHHAFDACHIYTSDIDFLPAIKEVRNLGKQVFVFGYTNGLSRESEFLTVPDQFTDLAAILKQKCRLLALQGTC